MNSQLNAEIVRIKHAEMAARAARPRFEHAAGHSLRPLDFAPAVAPVLAILLAVAIGAPISP